MASPYKRPRLSVFNQQGSEPDPELESARYRNDLSLKSRFEAIFEKYAQDFTDKADEIDIMTGEIVVNNGHIESMTDETDTGGSAPPCESLPHINGGSLLRAMTAPPRREDAYYNISNAEDVIMSIEQIAERAGTSLNDDSGLESEDDLFGIARSEEDGNETRISVTYESDCDSLPGDEVRERSSSPDSLFDVENSRNTSVVFQSGESEGQREKESGLSDEAILQQFGPEVGTQVLGVLQRRHDEQENHIEPAWRIPVPSAPVARAPAIQRNTESSTSLGKKRAPIPNRPIWQPVPNRDTSPRSKKCHESSLSRMSIESDDPLQASDNGRLAMYKPGKQAYAEPDDSEAQEADELDEAEYMNSRTEESSQSEDDGKGDKQSDDSLCHFCGKKFYNKSCLRAHFDRLIEKVDRRGQQDKLHDMQFIRAMRSLTVKRPGIPRLHLVDFRTAVELHEGEGSSFQEIVDSGCLRTRNKTGPQLEALYASHRDLSCVYDEANGTIKRWTAREELYLRKLCENKLVTMTTLRTKVKGRTQIEIGNKLADTWLHQLGILVKYKGVDESSSFFGMSNKGEGGMERHERKRRAHSRSSSCDLFDIPSQPVKQERVN